MVDPRLKDMHQFFRFFLHGLWRLAIFTVRLGAWCVLGGWVFYIAVRLFLDDPTDEEIEMREAG